MFNERIETGDCRVSELRWQKFYANYALMDFEGFGKKFIISGVYVYYLAICLVRYVRRYALMWRVRVRMFETEFSGLFVL